MSFPYFYGRAAEQYAFYRIPKLLFSDERFEALSTDAKLLYGMLIDRMELSMKNGWTDKDGRVFIYFTLEDARRGHTALLSVERYWKACWRSRSSTATSR